MHFSVVAAQLRQKTPTVVDSDVSDTWAMQYLRIYRETSSTTGNRQHHIPYQPNTIKMAWPIGGLANNLNHVLNEDPVY